MKANPLLKALVPKKAVNQILQNDYICDYLIYLKYDLKHSLFLVAFCIAVKDYHKDLPFSVAQWVMPMPKHKPITKILPTK